ncbi:MAG: hypothetical protein VYC34_08860, partial [Planctomycetota bacterium]|nr:hypothetical protein [Planctomycetota bacterium]
SGGGMFNIANSNPVVMDCDFLGNRALNGGGIYSEGSSPRVVNSAFGAPGVGSSGNTTSADGAAIFALGGLTRVEGSTFDSNAASSKGGVARVMGQGTLVMIGSRASNNSAEFGGAISLGGQTSASVYTSRFFSNSADRGGVMDVEEAGATTMVNCVLANNVSTGNIFDPGTRFGGGGIAALMATVSAVNCTFANNRMDGFGGSDDAGGILSESSTTVISNSIFWGNTSFNAVEAEDAQIVADGPGNSLTIARSIIEGYSGGFPNVGNIGENPLFASAASNDFSLSPGSPAVDAGDTTLVPEDVHDINGNMDLEERVPLDAAQSVRFIDSVNYANVGVADGAIPVVDMGAIEADANLPQVNPCVADLNGDGIVAAGDLSTLLGSWGPGGGLGPADFNEDGTVNAADLADLLAEWGACE